MALMQEGNTYMHLQDGKDTLLYVEVKPTKNEKELAYYRRMLEDFLEKFAKRKTMEA